MHIPLSVPTLTPSQAARPAAPFIAPSPSALGAAAGGGGFKGLGVNPQLLQTSPLLLQRNAQYLSRWCAAAFIGTSKRQDACSSPFRFPLLIEISCLPENNYCQWQLLQLKCLLIACNAQAKLGITCQVRNEFN